MFGKPSRKELERQIVSLKSELAERMFAYWHLEDIALDAQLVIESNNITKYKDIAEDIIDRVDELSLPLWACDPDE